MKRNLNAKLSLSKESVRRLGDRSAEAEVVGMGSYVSGCLNPYPSQDPCSGTCVSGHRCY